MVFIFIFFNIYFLHLFRFVLLNLLLYYIKCQASNRIGQMDQVYQLKSFNTDLKLLKTITATERIIGSTPKNIDELSTLLKHKTLPKKHSPAKIQKCRTWLKNKGVDLETIQQRVKNYSQILRDQKKLNNKEDNYFHIDLKSENVPQYLEKSYEYSTCNLLQFLMSRKKVEEKFIYKQVDNMRKTDKKKRFTISFERERMPDQRKKYLQIVSSIFNKQKQYPSIRTQLLAQLNKHFSQQSNHILWKILSTQLEKYSSIHHEDHNLALMFMQSLKLIQDELKTRIRGKDIDQYLSINYLYRVNGKSHIQRQTTWAKVWLYMISGLHKQAIQLIGNRHIKYTELIQAYAQSCEAINLGKPIKCNLKPIPSIKDTFYDQIIFCLNGESKYSNENLCDPDSLQFVWLVVRTTAIFWNIDKDKQYKFLKLRQGIVDNYKKSAYDSQDIRNMLYMLDYKTIIQLGPNSMMNKDDYLHFLLILEAYPELVKNTEIERLLIEQLSEIISELMVEKKTEYLYYIALMPSTAIVTQISTIIAASDAFNQFKWQELKTIIPEQIYFQLVRATAAQYAYMKGEYLKAGEKIIELIGNKIEAFDYFVKMLAKHYQGTQKFNQVDISKAESIGLKQSQAMQSQLYQKIFQLFWNIRQIKSLLLARDLAKSQAFIANNSFIFLSKNAMNTFIKVVEKLSENGGACLYFNYVKDIVKLAQIFFGRMEKIEQLNQFKLLLLNSCTYLIQTDSLIKYLKETDIQDLFQYLESTN